MKHLARIGVKYTTLRALIFAVGHFLIDVAVIFTVTDASSTQATIAAFLSPIFNTLWYWILDYAWTHFYKNNKESYHG